MYHRECTHVFLIVVMFVFFSNHKIYFRKDKFITIFEILFLVESVFVRFTQLCDNHLLDNALCVFVWNSLLSYCLFLFFYLSLSLPFSYSLASALKEVVHLLCAWWNKEKFFFQKALCISLFYGVSNKFFAFVRLYVIY